MRLGLFADSHMSDMEVTCKTRRPSLSYGKIKEAMESFVENGVELVICLGDLLNRCVDCADDEKEFSRLAEMIRSFNVPFYCVLGNHDIEIFSDEDFYRIGGFDRPPFSETFGDQTFIFLDACFFDDGERYSSKRVEWTNSYIPADQVKRLREVLADSNVKNATVFLHQLLNPDADPRYLIKNAEEIRKIIEASGKVKCVYSGHYHRGQSSSHNGIAYNVLPAMCIGEENRYFIVDID